MSTMDYEAEHRGYDGECESMDIARDYSPSPEPVLNANLSLKQTNNVDTTASPAALPAATDVTTMAFETGAPHQTVGTALATGITPPNPCIDYCSPPRLSPAEAA